MFVTFEGLDCSGKSTQAKLLVEKLETSLRCRVHLIREPGGTRISERIREILLDREHLEFSDVTELLLFSASRSQLVSEIIAPALRRKETVVCDRYCDSTTAYQGYGRGLDLQSLHDINRLATSGVMPDLTILLDIPVEEVARRKAGLGGPNDRMENAGRRFFERVRNGYLDLAKKDHKRFSVIDGTEPLKTVARSIWLVVEARLNEKKTDMRSLSERERSK